MSMTENKPNRLQAALGAAMGASEVAVTPAAPPAPAKSEKAVKKGRAARPSRDGRRLVAAHIPPKVFKQLKMIGVDEGLTTQEILEEAIELFLVKKGYRQV